MVNFLIGSKATHVGSLGLLREYLRVLTKLVKVFGRGKFYVFLKDEAVVSFVYFISENTY